MGHVNENRCILDCRRCIQHRVGFTLIELLVLVGVLGVLLAVLMPAMSSFRGQAQRTVEQNHARQLMIGFAAYANLNEDRVMPGHAPANFRVFDREGQLIRGNMLREAKRRYPLRIAPFVDFDIRALLLGDVLELLESYPMGGETSQHHQYAVSFAPSLGMNTQWIGGSSAPDSNLPPALLPSGHPDFALWNQLFDMSRYYVTRTSQVRHPERLIVFASARGSIPLLSGTGEEETNGDELGLMTAPAEGSYQVLSPRTSALSPESRWSERFDPGDEPANYGYLSFRHNREAVTALFDGSVSMMDQHRIRDMRHWSNWATDEDWVLPQRD